MYDPGFIYDEQVRIDTLLDQQERHSQERLCESCLYKQLEHTEWCYMFKEMPKDCHQFRKGEK